MLNLIIHYNQTKKCCSNITCMLFMPMYGWCVVDTFGLVFSPNEFVFPMDYKDDKYLNHKTVFPTSENHHQDFGIFYALIKIIKQTKLQIPTHFLQVFYIAY